MRGKTCPKVLPAGDFGKLGSIAMSGDDNVGITQDQGSKSSRLDANDPVRHVLTQTWRRDLKMLFRRDLDGLA